MDALLLALIACLAGEMGGRSQLLSLMLGVRYRFSPALVGGIVCAAVLSAALAAYAAMLVANVMNHDARHLFMALAFLTGGFGLLWPPKAPDTLAGWKLGAFATGFAGLLILSFGSAAQFLIAGIAVARGDPALAAAGGALGVALACLLPAMLGDASFRQVPVRWVRYATAAIFLIVGGAIAVNALGLT